MAITIDTAFGPKSFSAAPPTPADVTDVSRVDRQVVMHWLLWARQAERRAEKSESMKLRPPVIASLGFAITAATFIVTKQLGPGQVFEENGMATLSVLVLGLIFLPLALFVVGWRLDRELGHIRAWVALFEARAEGGLGKP